MPTFKRGQKVRIKRGAPVRSTAPNHHGAIPAKRSYVVTVRSVEEPCTAPGHERPAMVHWAGTGGYWRWCPTEYAQPLEEK